MADECIQRKSNLENCTCTYTSCSRRGNCCACVAYHRSSNEIPGCFFSPEAEKDWDRSIRRFIKDKS
ncbi:MAG: hypothetical protein D6734_00345 [Candidatus Schekmanbacteria bacterium]|nr:MAG: hypothetical protein D6734_00345 [Candidatus Schekmanbacteria bacterium]